MQQTTIVKGVATKAVGKVIEQIARALEVALIYEDGQSRERAEELCNRVRSLGGSGAVRCKAWNVNQLGEAGERGKAIWAAINADVIMVSILASETVHPQICAWVDVWLALRQPRSGALIAMIEASERPSAPLDRVQKYLRMVARQGGMEFLLRETVASKASEAASDRLFADQISSQGSRSLSV